MRYLSTEHAKSLKSILNEDLSNIVRYTDHNWQAEGPLPRNQNDKKKYMPLDIRILVTDFAAWTEKTYWTLTLDWCQAFWLNKHIYLPQLAFQFQHQSRTFSSAL